MKRTSARFALALLVLCFSSFALADNLVFDLSPTNGTTFRSGAFGPGQGVNVNTTQTITGVGFYISGDAQNLNYFIFDGTNTTVLASTQFAWGGSGNENWVYAPINLTLNGGSEYWFGIIGTANFQVGYIYPPFVYSASGMDAVTSGNTNYCNYASPSLCGGGSAEIGLRILENETPEPASLVLLGSGLIGIAGGVRRKFAA